MSCIYQYYKNENEYFPRLYCKLNDNYCICSKQCYKVNKYISNGNEKECYIFNMEKKKSIPKDAYFVQTKRLSKTNKMYLYVLIDEKVKRIETEIKDINQDYVYLKKVGEDYKASLVPFPKETKEDTNDKTKKRTYAKKK